MKKEKKVKKMRDLREWWESLDRAVRTALRLLIMSVILLRADGFYLSVADMEEMAENLINDARYAERAIEILETAGYVEKVNNEWRLTSAGEKAVGYARTLFRKGWI